MTDNNKKGMQKRSQLEKAKDDKILNLQILNEKLVKEITQLRKQNVVFSTNLTEMRSEIESSRRMTEELKDTEKEFTRELARKDAKYQAAISEAGKQLLEAEERFNTEISAKEDECKAVNVDKKNLEATVLQLKNQIEARSTESEETNKGLKLEKDMLLSQIVATEKETAKISRSSQMAQEAFDAEKQNLLSRIADLQTNLKLMVREKGSLIEANRELSSEGESLKALLNEYSEKLVSMEDEKQALEAVSVSTTERLEDLRKKNATMEKEHGRKYGEYQAAISQAEKQLLEAEERFNREISAKEDECKAVNLDNKNLDATVLQLKNRIEARSAELEANNKGRKLEKDVLLSQIAAAEKQTAEISRSSQMAQEAFNVEKENLLTRLAELQTNFELTVCEKGLLSETNRELTAEAESLKAHLNEYSVKLVRMEDEKKALETMSLSRAERLEDLLKQNETMEKEHGRKYGEYQAAISQAGKQLLETEKRFNTEISAKEDECKAVNLDKKNLEDTVLELKNRYEARSDDLEATNRCLKLEKDVLLSQIVAAKMETTEITRSNQIALEAFHAEKENLLSRLAELQTNLESMDNEKGLLSETNRELKTEGESLKAQLNEYSQRLVSVEDEKKALEAASLSKAELFEACLKQIATMEKEHGRKYGEYQSAISQAGRQLLEAEERFNTEISTKEDECKALNLDKKNLEATVLQLKNQIEARSAELEATNKGRKLEKDFFLSQIVAAKKETTEITRSNQIALEAFNAEKENLLIRLAEVQTNLELMAREKGSLSETNRELKTEGEFLKAQLNEYSEKLVSIEDERRVLEAASLSKAELFEALLKQNATMEKEICSLQQQVDENVEEHSHVIQHYKVEEYSLRQQNEMLEKEVLNARCLLEIRIAENDKLSNQVEELTKTIVELQVANVSVLQEKNDLKKEFDSLHIESVMKYKVMEEKHSELFREKEEEAKTINSMRGEINSLMESVEKYKGMDEKHSELFKEKEQQENTINSLRGEINSLVESVKKYKVMEEKHSKLFKEKEEQAKTVQSLRGEINSFMEESVEKYKLMEEKHSELFKEKEEQAKTVNSLRGEINSLMKSVKKYKVMEEKHSELFNEKEEQAKIINSLQGEITSLMEYVKKYKVIDEKLSESFKGKKEQAKTINPLRGEINSVMESVKKYKVIEEKHSELSNEKEEHAKTINSLRGEINSLMNEKSSLSRHSKEATKKHEGFPEKCMQSQHPTIAQEKRTELVDIKNHMDVHKKPKLTDVKGKEKRNSNGGQQSKAQKKPPFKL